MQISKRLVSSVINRHRGNNTLLAALNNLNTEMTSQSLSGMVVQVYKIKLHVSDPLKQFWQPDDK